MHLKIVLKGSFFLVFLGGKKCPWKNWERRQTFFLTDRSHHKMAKENVKTFFGTILCQNFENQGFLVQIYLSFEQISFKTHTFLSISF